ncbi:hypothetical protein MJO28_004006 [Puccinia striiformis f. sp. tritici]|uniref:BZIP domain-containing protein n=2 Tax=Puccinia striiformis f. sp. tritici TaxID=168172 RepID=A0A0L0VQS6_9BASI|nr:hypothetical protein Pst134EA_007361 [Puccinia striiformis f. sp. tritici]KAI9616968.1 hypothetical protein H4Q26_010605 [Puccinia striiformis f. sp. tritici PST-130]KNF01365.1 hypothetical protein PSTG_05465 [Puccinia striiformis f. sp. tritici PST-78]KAH9460323.1 hypothetical protein Pst134EB_008502 [Puccinia striiformis f. sp. tritici]KAH9470095.1 hypothetical protein Pst134EA_007361 [Puccinia striiformis f. sp. tritici]KAI7956911.1 hypothetical protein MJO28_004006 [Puccinia striiformis
MFSHDSFDFHDSNEAFSEISASGMESLYSAESSTSKAEFPRRKRHMTSETIEKRKQQNRTAQKAFRERKERHLREIESQLSYKQHQIQAICGQNRYLEDKCLFLSNQYEILEKKFQDAQNRLKSFEEFSTKQTLPGRYDPLQGILGTINLDGSMLHQNSLQ